MFHVHTYEIKYMFSILKYSKVIDKHIYMHEIKYMSSNLKYSQVFSSILK